MIGTIQDITERKLTEIELRSNEEQLKLKLDTILNPDTDISGLELKNIIAAKEIQSILDELYPITQMGTSILDMKGNILEATGWTGLCAKFHRANAATCKNCVESDLECSMDLKPGEFRSYKCRNNLWDIATPLYIGNKHLGNIFTGQFFYDDEEPDENIFVEQAKKYGFDLESYMRR